MPRNLDRRVELMVPIKEEHLSERIEHILHLQMPDNSLRWLLNSDGTYTLAKVKDGTKKINSQELLEKYVSKIYNRTRKQSTNYVKRLADKLLKES